MLQGYDLLDPGKGYTKIINYRNQYFCLPCSPSESRFGCGSNLMLIQRGTNSKRQISQNSDNFNETAVGDTF